MPVQYVYTLFNIKKNLYKTISDIVFSNNNAEIEYIRGYFKKVGLCVYYTTRDCYFICIETNYFLDKASYNLCLPNLNYEVWEKIKKMNQLIPFESSFVFSFCRSDKTRINELVIDTSKSINPVKKIYQQPIDYNYKEELESCAMIFGFEL